MKTRLELVYNDWHVPAIDYALNCVHVAAAAAKDAAGQIDLNKAMEYKAKFDELTTDESSKKDD